MTSILGITAPIFLLIALGFASVRWQVLSKEHIRGMGLFVLKIALPILIFTALLKRNLSDIWQPQYFIAYGLGSLIALAAGLWVYYRHLKQPLEQAAVMSMGCAMSNTGFIGFGILSMVLGQQAAVYFSMTLIIENLLMLPIVLTLIALAQHNPDQGKANLAHILAQTFVNVLKNPMIVALFAGMLFGGMHIQLPTAFDRMLSMMAACSAPLAIFVIGGNLVGTNVQAAGKHALIVSAIKLVLMPVSVFIIFALLPNVSTEMHYAGTLLAAVSMATMFSLFGLQHGIAARSAAVLLMTTMLMFFSVSTVLWLWSHHLPSP